MANADGLKQILIVIQISNKIFLFFINGVRQNTMYTFVLISACILYTFLLNLTAILDRNKNVEKNCGTQALRKILIQRFCRKVFRSPLITRYQ